LSRGYLFAQTTRLSSGRIQAVYSCRLTHLEQSATTLRVTSSPSLKVTTFKKRLEPCFVRPQLLIMT